MRASHLHRSGALHALRHRPQRYDTPHCSAHSSSSTLTTRASKKFPLAAVHGRVLSNGFVWVTDFVRRHHRSLSSSSSESIFDVGEHDESIEILTQASQDLLSSDVAKQLAATKAIVSELQPAIAVEAAPTELRRHSKAELDELQPRRDLWSDVFAEDGEGAVPEDALPVESKNLNEDESEALLQSLRFGEISFDAAAEVLNWVQAVGGLSGSGDVLCDMKSGDGRFLVAASLLHPFDLVQGMAETEEGHDEVATRLERLQGLMKARGVKLAAKALELELESSKEPAWAAQLAERMGGGGGGMLAVLDLLGADEWGVQEWSEAAVFLPPGALLVSIGGRLPCPALQLVEARPLLLSWGDVYCYLLQRVPLDPDPAAPPSNSARLAGTEEEAAGASGGGGAAWLPVGSDVLQQRAVRESGALGSLLALVSRGATSQLRMMAAMALALAARSEVNARQLLAEGAVEELVGLAEIGEVHGGGAGGAAGAVDAAAVMGLRAMAEHPCGVPAVIDSPDCIATIVKLLASPSLPVAAGAADALGSCLVLPETRPVIANAGAVAPLKALKKRAASALHEHARETAEMVLDRLEPPLADKIAPDSGGGSPLHRRLQELRVSS